MTTLRVFLALSTVLIYAISLYAAQKQGINWPAVYFGDLLNMDWRSQFNFDFLVHLLLLATWISWREGLTPKGLAYGFLSIFMGGMFGFPYLLIATYHAKGDARKILLGVHAQNQQATA